MGKANEADIQNAIQSVKSGVSVTSSATRWGVPRSTLRHRLKGTKTHAAAAESQQRLSKQLEVQLGGWITTMTAINEPPTHKQVREVATQLLALQGDLRPLGKNWVITFLRRNPHIKIMKESTGLLDESAVNGAMDETNGCIATLKGSLDRIAQYVGSDIQP
ncbi:Helix-turn-helix, Psq [Cordyceps militaris CM01]|uniref:Helix-turn-helix, Psq n=1 Tax=Cordyceps militaris (strain CM01) TaxID=983644 RepID=G3JMV7_CORMM|nr:Helix-turn-helix, Psq [Cordyceps militaris CM01]EGX90139.1 Helix-turn-helix, Psq [Cordyceps militaris CM01]